MKGREPGHKFEKYDPARFYEGHLPKLEPVGGYFGEKSEPLKVFEKLEELRSKGEFPIYPDELRDKIREFLEKGKFEYGFLKYPENAAQAAKEMIEAYAKEKGVAYPSIELLDTLTRPYLKEKGLESAITYFGSKENLLKAAGFKWFSTREPETPAEKLKKAVSMLEGKVEADQHFKTPWLAALDEAGKEHDIPTKTLYALTKPDYPRFGAEDNELQKRINQLRGHWGFDYSDVLDKLRDLRSELYEKESRLPTLDEIRSATPRLKLKQREKALSLLSMKEKYRIATPVELLADRLRGYLINKRGSADLEQAAKDLDVKSKFHLLKAKKILQNNGELDDFDLLKSTFLKNRLQFYHDFHRKKQYSLGDLTEFTGFSGDEIKDIAKEVKIGITEEKPAASLEEFLNSLKERYRPVALAAINLFRKGERVITYPAMKEELKETHDPRTVTNYIAQLKASGVLQDAGHLQISPGSNLEPVLKSEGIVFKEELPHVKEFLLSMKTRHQPVVEAAARLFQKEAGVIELPALKEALKDKLSGRMVDSYVSQLRDLAILESAGHGKLSPGIELKAALEKEGVSFEKQLPPLEEFIRSLDGRHQPIIREFVKQFSRQKIPLNVSVLVDPLRETLGDKVPYTYISELRKKNVLKSPSYGKVEPGDELKKIIEAEKPPHPMVDKYLDLMEEMLKEKKTWRGDRPLSELVEAFNFNESTVLYHFKQASLQQLARSKELNKRKERLIKEIDHPDVDKYLDYMGKMLKEKRTWSREKPVHELADEFNFSTNTIIDHFGKASPAQLQRLKDLNEQKESMLKPPAQLPEELTPRDLHSLFERDHPGKEGMDKKNALRDLAVDFFTKEGWTDENFTHVEKELSKAYGEKSRLPSLILRELKLRQETIVPEEKPEPTPEITPEEEPEPTPAITPKGVEEKVKAYWRTLSTHSRHSTQKILDTLSEYRKGANPTKTELGEKTGLSKPTFYKHFNGIGVEIRYLTGKKFDLEKLYPLVPKEEIIPYDEAKEKVDAYARSTGDSHARKSLKKILTGLSKLEEGSSPTTGQLEDELGMPDNTIRRHLKDMGVKPQDLAGREFELPPPWPIVPEEEIESFDEVRKKVTAYLDSQHQSAREGIKRIVDELSKLEKGANPSIPQLADETGINIIVLYERLGGMGLRPCDLAGREFELAEPVVTKKPKKKELKKPEKKELSVYARSKLFNALNVLRNVDLATDQEIKEAIEDVAPYGIEGPRYLENEEDAYTKMVEEIQARLKVTKPKPPEKEPEFPITPTEEIKPFDIVQNKIFEYYETLVQPRQKENLNQLLSGLSTLDKGARPNYKQIRRYSGLTPQIIHNLLRKMGLDPHDLAGRDFKVFEPLSEEEVQEKINKRWRSLVVARAKQNVTKLINSFPEFEEGTDPQFKDIAKKTGLSNHVVRDHFKEIGIRPCDVAGKTFEIPKPGKEPISELKELKDEESIINIYTQLIPSPGGGITLQDHKRYARKYARYRLYGDRETARMELEEEGKELIGKDIAHRAKAIRRWATGKEKKHPSLLDLKIKSREVTVVTPEDIKAPAGALEPRDAQKSEITQRYFTFLVRELGPQSSVQHLQKAYRDLSEEISKSKKEGLEGPLENILLNLITGAVKARNNKQAIVYKTALFKDLEFNVHDIPKEVVVRLWADYAENMNKYTQAVRQFISSDTKIDDKLLKNTKSWEELDLNKADFSYELKPEEKPSEKGARWVDVDSLPPRTRALVKLGLAGKTMKNPTQKNVNTIIKFAVEDLKRVPLIPDKEIALLKEDLAENKKDSIMRFANKHFEGPLDITDIRSKAIDSFYKRTGFVPTPEQIIDEIRELMGKEAIPTKRAARHLAKVKKALEEKPEEILGEDWEGVDLDLAAQRISSLLPMVIGSKTIGVAAAKTLHNEGSAEDANEFYRRLDDLEFDEDRIEKAEAGKAVIEIGRDKDVIVDEEDLNGRIAYITRILRALDMKKKIKEFRL